MDPTNDDSFDDDFNRMAAAVSKSHSHNHSNSLDLNVDRIHAAGDGGLVPLASPSETFRNNSSNHHSSSTTRSNNKQQQDHHVTSSPLAAALSTAAALAAATSAASDQLPVDPTSATFSSQTTAMAPLHQRQHHQQQMQIQTTGYQPNSNLVSSAPPPAAAASAPVKKFRAPIVLPPLPPPGFLEKLQQASGTGGGSSNNDSKDLSSTKKRKYPFQSASSSAIPPMFANRKLRCGKWTPEEEAYADALITFFESGHSMVNEENGITLRSFLSRKLHCAPMRISKKFKGKQIGKLVFSRKPLQYQQMSMVAFENCLVRLRETEVCFYQKVFPQSNGPFILANGGIIVHPKPVPKFAPLVPNRPTGPIPPPAALGAVAPHLHQIAYNMTTIHQAPTFLPQANSSGTTASRRIPQSAGTAVASTTTTNATSTTVPVLMPNDAPPPVMAMSNPSTVSSSIYTYANHPPASSAANTASFPTSLVVSEAMPVEQLTSSTGKSTDPTTRTQHHQETNLNDTVRKALEPPPHIPAAHELPDFLSGFDKIASSASGQPIKLEKIVPQFNGSHFSPTFTSKSFDDFHRLLGKDLSPLGQQATQKRTVEVQPGEGLPSMPLGQAFRQVSIHSSHDESKSASSSSAPLLSTRALAIHNHPANQSIRKVVDQASRPAPNASFHNKATTNADFAAGPPWGTQTLGSHNHQYPSQLATQPDGWIHMNDSDIRNMAAKSALRANLLQAQNQSQFGTNDPVRAGIDHSGIQTSNALPANHADRHQNAPYYSQQMPAAPPRSGNRSHIVSERSNASSQSDVGTEDEDTFMNAFNGSSYESGSNTATDSNPNDSDGSSQGSTRHRKTRREQQHDYSDEAVGDTKSSGYEYDIIYPPPQSRRAAS